MPRNLGPQDFIAVDANLPCLNPNCHSHGAPHVGCKCYSTSGGPIHRGDYENRGDVNASHFKENQPGYKPDFSSSERSLSGFLGEGKSVVDHSVGFNAKSFAEGGAVHYCSHKMPHHPDCEYYAKGGDVEANTEFHVNPELAVEHAIAHHGLLHALTKTGLSRSEDPHKPAQDFIDHSKRGRKKTEFHTHGMFEKKSPELEHPANIDALKEHLEDLHANPEKLMNLGGNLADTIPDHAGMLAAKAANATQYLNSIKPMSNQASPFDLVTPPTKMEQFSYRRQLALAEQPLSILSHIKQGTVNPQDLKTIHTLYPQLSKSIADKSFEKVAEAKGNNVILPYKQRSGLSSILGPLDSTQTPQFMQAILQSNSPVSQEPSPGKKKSGATARTQDTLEKTDKLYETPVESLVMNKKD